MEFLADTKTQFLADLAATFGERAGTFGEELETLLFELWVRARSRPLLPASDEVLQKEFELKLEKTLEELAHRPWHLRPELTHAFAAAVEMSFTELPNAFAEQLYKALKTESPLLEIQFDYAGEVRLRLLEPVDKRPPGWLPVFQDEHTGELAGFDLPGNTRFLSLTQEMDLVVYDDEWHFPPPRPRYTFNDCLHVRLWTDDKVKLLNHTCFWDSEYDSNEGYHVIHAVRCPAVLPGTRIRAAYPVIKRIV